MTPDEANQVVKLVLGAFPRDRVKLDGAAIVAMRDAWHELLEDLDYATVRAATMRALRLAVHMPSAGEIRRAALEGVRGPRRPGLLAWGDVVREIARVGVHGRPVFADAAVGAIVQSIGWATLCNAPVSDTSLRARFVDAYDEGSLAVEREVLGRDARTGPALVGGIVAGLLPGAKP